MFGREPFCPLDTILPTLTTLPRTVREYALQAARAREVAQNNIASSQVRIKERYDKTSNDQPFESGDLVWIFFPEINVGGSPKLFHNWSGPYLLMDKSGETNFKVVQAHDLKSLKNPVHVNRMKRFHHRAVLPPVPQDLEKLMPEQRNDAQDLSRVDRLRYLQTIPKTREKPPEPVKVDDSRGPDTDHLADVEMADPPVLRTEANQSDDTQPDSPQPEVTQPEDGQMQQPQLGPDEFEINKIIKGRYNKAGDIEYLIDWKGYPPSARTYEPEENLNEFAKEYVKSHEIPVTGQKQNN